MATTITEIIALLESKLRALKNGTAPIFADVFTYAHGDFKKYPTAEVYESGSPAIVADTHRNERTFNFVIKLYQEQSAQGRDKQPAAIIMRQAVDAVIIAFDKDKDLGGEVQIVRPVSVDINYKKAAGDYNFATFKVDVVVLVNNF